VFSSFQEMPWSSVSSSQQLRLPSQWPSLRVGSSLRNVSRLSRRLGVPRPVREEFCRRAGILLRPCQSRCVFHCSSVSRNACIQRVGVHSLVCQSCSSLSVPRRLMNTVKRRVCHM
jgi:hypothetical protein